MSRTFVAQQVALFGKAVGILKRWGSLEEVVHWRRALKLSSPAPIPIHSLLPKWGLGVTGHPPASAIMFSLTCLSYHYGQSP